MWVTVDTNEVRVGVVANPASGRDIRRLVAKASVFPTAEKANMVQRLLTAFAKVGVTQVLLSTDLGGISAAVLRAVSARPAGSSPWPELRFCDKDPLTDSAQDTTNAVHRMVAAGVQAIICLGGDGTARLAAAACGDVPLLALSTGTNNTFPTLREATVAGLAAGLVAVGAVSGDQALRRMSALEVITATRRERALVDVCATTSRHIGARALWNPAGLRDLYCTFAEPDAIGLSSIPGLLCPSPRHSPDGVGLRLAPAERARWVVHAPIAPGLVAPVGVQDWWRMAPGDTAQIALPNGVLAIDGEREVELSGAETAAVTLRPDGPRCIDVPAVMSVAAAEGLLRRSQTPSQRGRLAEARA